MYLFLASQKNIPWWTFRNTIRAAMSETTQTLTNELKLYRSKNPLLLQTFEYSVIVFSVH